MFSKKRFWEVFATCLAAGVCLGVCGCGEAAQRPPSIGICTYNIHHGSGLDNKTDLSRIAEVIRQLDVQVVGLQEVDYFNARNPIDQSACIAACLGPTWQARFYPSIAWNGGQYGNAVLYDSSVLTLIEDTHLPLPGAEARSAGLVRLEHENGFCFQFIITHLTHRRDEEQLRCESIEAIEAARCESIPAILAGDLNATAEAPSIQRLTALGWRILNPLDQATYPADRPTQTIDYIAVLAEDEIFNVQDVAVVHNELTHSASDHLPVAARVVVKGGTLNSLSCPCTLGNR
jgi:endonuclease/exonuclease/phosphatase family metal-dependent hydrolase